MTTPTATTTAATTGTDDVILVARGISKSYGGVRALKDVTFTAYRGKVNVVVGENGAGKSTLMKILSGSEQPTTGEILIDGTAVLLNGPRAAMAAGIGIIHQELSLFPNLSIAENMFAGREMRRGGPLVAFGAQRARTREVLGRLGQELEPDTLVADLPIGQQQLVEIGRVLLDDVRILIMDEPTSALSNHEVDVLFSVMEDLREHGVTVIYISHKLDEFRRIGDHVTVLRDGRLVAEESMTRTDTAWIVRQMVGRDPNALFSRSNATRGDLLLEVRGLTAPGPTRPVVDDVSFTVSAGEVVGIYGLMGAGRTELMECLMGTRKSLAGEIRVRGALAGGSSVQRPTAGRPRARARGPSTRRARADPVGAGQRGALHPAPTHPLGSARVGDARSTPPPRWSATWRSKFPGWMRR